MRRLAFIMALVVLLSACAGRQDLRAPSPVLDGTVISRTFAAMTDIMVHDVTNPPLASRFYAYAGLSGYEVLALHHKELQSFAGRINGFQGISEPKSEKPYDPELAAVLAMIETARKMQPSGFLLEEYQKEFLDSCRDAGFPEETIEGSTAFAKDVSRQVLEYAKSDGYNRISNFARYTPLQFEGAWYPTPPSYLPAVEPNFNSVRPFLLDSASQFKPKEPVPYSSDKNSPFFKMLLLNCAGEPSPEQKEIAAFWDCNPFAVEEMGHLMVGIKKISPGAHWLGITGIAAMNAGKNFEETMEISTVVAMGLMDAFISCWDEKFRSNRIRPETAIRKLVDPNWRPLLQTPPFPEYLSGHSVVSTTSASILENYFGQQFSFKDTIEVNYGLAPRSFSSFGQAADEAAVSRFYGGIHFMDAIDEGKVQGRQVGELYIKKLGIGRRSMAGK